MTERVFSLQTELRELDLPSGSYMVMGSGILDALGIRPAQDVDMVVREDIYADLKKQEAWHVRVASNGSEGLERGVFQMYDRWFDESTIKTLEELLPDAEWVDGVAYNSLAKLSLYKTRRGREKDLEDLVAIQRYQESR